MLSLMCLVLCLSCFLIRRLPPSSTRTDPLFPYTTRVRSFNCGYWSEGWFHAKLLLVLGLSGYHGWLIGYFKKLKRGERPLSEKRLRLLNEVPGVVAAIVVVLAVVRPF